jgi:hypothetical protein
MSQLFGMFEGHSYLEKHGIYHDSAHGICGTSFSEQIIAQPANKFNIAFGVLTFIAVRTTARNWSAV